MQFDASDLIILDQRHVEMINDASVLMQGFFIFVLYFHSLELKLSKPQRGGWFRKWKWSHLVVSGSYQAPLSMAFSRQKYWSGLPFASPGDLPDPGIEPGSPALQADVLLSEPFIISIDIAFEIIMKPYMYKTVENLLVYFSWGIFFLIKAFILFKAYAWT